MRRHALNDEQWARVRALLPETGRGPRSDRKDRLFVDAVLYRAKTGISWRDLPERFGPWKSVYNRFANWTRRGHWERIFRDLQYEIDEAGCLVAGSVVRGHQDAAGGRGGINCNALGHSRGGFSTKLHAVVDAKGRPLHVALTPGHRHEMTAALEMLRHARGKVLIADTGYDSDSFRAAIKACGLKPIIHPNPTRRNKVHLDRKKYRARYLVEVFFHRLKRF
jgi:transposase